VMVCRLSKTVGVWRFKAELNEGVVGFPPNADGDPDRIRWVR